MKISKFQFDDNVINLVTYEDFHQSVEDEMSIYKYNNNCYIVVELYEILEDGVHPHIVFKYTTKIESVEKNREIVEIILDQYEKDI